MQHRIEMRFLVRLPHPLKVKQKAALTLLPIQPIGNPQYRIKLQQCQARVQPQDQPRDQLQLITRI